MLMLSDGTQVDGYISRIKLPNGKTYALKCELVQVRALNCPNCGAPFFLKYGEGHCEYCDTHFTTHFTVEEV